MRFPNWLLQKGAYVAPEDRERLKRFQGFVFYDCATPEALTRDRKAARKYRKLRRQYLRQTGRSVNSRVNPFWVIGAQANEQARKRKLAHQQKCIRQMKRAKFYRPNPYRFPY